MTWVIILLVIAILCLFSISRQTRVIASQLAEVALEVASLREGFDDKFGSTIPDYRDD